MKKIDPQETIKKLTTFLQVTIRREGFTRALVAVSGGVDSATSLALTVHALGANKVHPVLLPYGSTNEDETGDALKFVKFLRIPSKNIHVVNIQPFVDPIISTDPYMNNLRRGNIMARIRMIVLYDLTKKLTALVIGTENKTEHLLGYYTRFGDAASDIEPLRHLYKSEAYALARHLAVPQAILSKPPTAGLWPGQTDEEELGFSYALVDKVLAWHSNYQLSKEEIIKKGFDPLTIDRIWMWIEKGRVKTRLPYCAKRTRVLFSGGHY